MKPLKYYGINLSLIVVTFLITSIVIGSIAFTLGRYAGSRAQIREHKDKEIVIIKKILSTYQVSELQVSNSSGNHIHIYGNLSNVNDLKSIKNEIETNLGKASDTNIQFDIELVH